MSSTLKPFIIQIYSLERYVRPTVISYADSHGFVEISVGFIKRRPTSDLELVFKDDNGDEFTSNQYKEGDLVHWTLDMFVRFAASSHSGTD